ncbi:hypothetical protein [Stakelama pacifica]|uniref:Uncharacterized protein n=1 Tax=Stakelama pacifica TaxID=517720 RepID=A0A4R6FN05_9SPHN|nr:hypothetical protein [Stakelama pacifica]TDN82962.1 hypothetical protein EV664_105160 [Stakelama pacifica]GGO95069.1 hypothetical protein GCM10011329_18380 [Stakelama pacifica]
MLSALLSALLPNDLWTCLSAVFAVLLIVGVWIMPALEMQVRIAITAGVVVVVTIGALYGLWQGAEEKAAGFRIEAEAAAAQLANAEKRMRVLEQAAAEREADRTEVQTMKDDLTDAIRNADAGAAPGPAAVALGCARLRRAGSTSSPEYQRICAGR